MKKLSIFLIASLFTICCNAQTIGIQLNLEQGKEYLQHATGSATLVQELMGQEMKITIVANSSTSFLVQSIDDTIYTIEAKYQKMEMDMKIGDGGEMPEIENQKKDMVRFFNAMTGKPFILKLSKSGKVVDVQNFEKILLSAFDELTEMTEDKKAQLKAQVEKSFGAGAIKKRFSIFTDAFPDAPVAKGSKWNKPQKSDELEGFAIDMNTEYELIEMAPTYVQIKGNAKISLGEDKYQEQNGVFVKSVMEGAAVSDTKVDRATGWVIETKSTLDLTGTVHIKRSKEQEEGMGMPMTVKIEAIITN